MLRTNPISSFLTAPEPNGTPEICWHALRAKVKAMGTIINFPRDLLRQPARTAHQGSAQIVIFPGVRVERYDFSLADRLTPPRRRGRPSRIQALEIDSTEA